jgi:hypothetical protein
MCNFGHIFFMFFCTCGLYGGICAIAMTKFENILLWRQYDNSMIHTTKHIQKSQTELQGYA